MEVEEGRPRGAAAPHRGQRTALSSLGTATEAEGTAWSCVSGRSGEGAAPEGDGHGPGCPGQGSEHSSMLPELTEH